jgi:DNA polymerase III alpha subunit
MKYDKFGQAYCDSDELFLELLRNPDLELHDFLVTDPEQFNTSVRQTYSDLPQLKKYHAEEFASLDVSEFDQRLQSHWYMPDEYQNLDIAQWILDQCHNQSQLQRVGQELLMYQERDMFDLLRYLKYLVDTMQQHQIVWGVGRGSSVASYVLYLMGVHRIDSLYYDLDITEFLK